MLRLLSIEFQKMRASRIFKGFIIAYFAILSCIALFASIELDLGFVKVDFAEQGLFDTPLLWHINTYIASMIKWFLAIIIVTSVVSEYQYGTLKQNLIDGLSKREFILSKLSSVFLFALVSCIFVFVVSVLMNQKSEVDSGLFVGIEYLGAYFLRLLLFLSFSFFVAILIKRSAFTFFLIFIWWVLEGVVQIGIFGLSSIANYLPLSSSSSLMREPFTRMKFIKSTTDMMTQGEGLGYDYSIPLQAVWVCIVYTLLFSFASYWLVKKRDL